MVRNCAACQRARALGNKDALCESCQWLVVRTKVVAVSSDPVVDDESSDDAPSVPARQTADLLQTDRDNAEHITLLGELAVMVGESAPDVIGRVLRAVAIENSTAYKTELKRLTAKFIATMEAAEGGRR
jgi:hypothetical protein